MIRPWLLALALFAGCGPAVPSPAITPAVAVVPTLNLAGPIDPGEVRAFNAGSEVPRQPARAELCGQPTRKGPPCRNRVKGGGPCWRHGGR